MKRIQTVKTRDLKESVKNGGCGVYYAEKAVFLSKITAFLFEVIYGTSLSVKRL